MQRMNFCPIRPVLSLHRNELPHTQPPHLPQEHAINVTEQKHDVHHKHLHPIFYQKKQRKISDPVRFLKSDHPHV